MWTHHLPDDVLLLAMDGDLPSRRLRRARRHLSACAACAARLDDLERTLAEASRLARSESAAEWLAHDEARARLIGRMSESRDERHWPPQPSSFMRSAWTPVGLSMVAAVVAGILVWPAVRPFLAPAQQSGGVFLRPRADLTPGSTVPLTIGELCAPAGARTARPVARALHQQVFADYGADFGRAAEYELDHLITPELGGASDAGNLWPQPYGRTPWNAYVKDELELLLHQRVCDGTLDLATAQREIAGDWIAAYKRHFNTDVPLRDYTQSPLSAADADFLRAELGELGVTPPHDADGRVLMVLLKARASGPATQSAGLDHELAIPPW